MLVKQIFHYLVVVITFITMFGAILLLINEFCFFSMIPHWKFLLQLNYYFPFSLYFCYVF